MIGIELQGGLGNQLFQIYTALAYSLENKIPFVLPETKYDIQKRQTYWNENSLLEGMKRFTSDSKINVLQMYKFIEPSFHYTPIPVKQHILLKGYFQSYKYFDKHQQDITRLLQIHKKQEQVKGQFEKHYEKDLQDNPICISLHFRIGDYKALPDCHPILLDDYYLFSIMYIIQKCKEEKRPIKIFYLCEKQNNDEVFIRIHRFIKFLHNKSIACEFIKLDDNMSDWQQLLVMSICDHNIIANSSFSWWGAYLNKNPNKIVVYPQTWFGVKMQHHKLHDMYPNTWIKQQ